jgi:antitoxin MazE
MAANFECSCIQADGFVYLLDTPRENAVQVRIAKWGNSLGLRVPHDIAARLGLTEGARVDVEASDDGRIIVTRSRRRFTLDELLAGMTADREHVLEDDDPTGEERI